MKINSIIFGMACIFMMQAAPAQAQNEGQMGLGFCNHEIKEGTSIGRGDSGTVEAAILIAGQYTNDFENPEIIGVNLAVANRINVQQITVWIRKSLDGPNIAEKSLERGSDPDILKGWNSISLDERCPLEAGSDFYLGCTYTLKGAGYPVAIGGQSREGGLYLRTDGDWTDESTNLGGCLSIEAIFEAKNMPQYDLDLISVEAPSFLQIGKTTAVPITVKNVASKNISVFDVSYSISGANTESTHFSRSIKPFEQDTIEIEITPLADNRILNANVTVTITSIDDGEDRDLSNNSLSREIDIVKYDFTRRVLIEEFTTEKCVNCPRAARTLHEVLDVPYYQENTVTICRHSGYRTDFLTNDADREMVWLYDGGSFCPALMLDRTGVGHTPVVSFPEADELKKLIDGRLRATANSAIDIEAYYDKNANAIHVDVSGGRYREFGDTPMRISVCLVEDNVNPEYQKGADDNFRHNHVARAYNSIWGDLIEWDADDNYSYSCNLDMSADYKHDDLYVVAFINEYDNNSPTLCKVDNCARSSIDWNSDAIESIYDMDDPVVRTLWYDLAGRPVSPSFSGFKLCIEVHQSGKITQTKILN